MPDPDEPLNPLAVAESRRPPASPPVGNDVPGALGWTIVAAGLPLIVDVIFGLVIRNKPAVSGFHLGICLFALSLAALVRILGHGRGMRLLPALTLAAVVQILIALYFGGTFSQRELHRGNVGQDLVYLNSHGTLYSNAVAFRQLRSDLEAVSDTAPPENAGGYVALALFGGFSLFVLIRYWDRPTDSERLAAAETHAGQI